MLFEEIEHPTMETFDLEGRLRALETFGMGRTLEPNDRVDRRVRVADAPRGEPPVFGDETLLLTTNNSLGFATDERVRRAAKRAIDGVGTGAGGSRVSTGDTVAHHELERALATTKRTDRALAFSSGYAANVGTITALYPNVIFSDEYNHASLIEASRMTDADTEVYDHCDADDLAARMERRAEAGPTEKWLIVTDSIFSMDGDVAPLAELCNLAEAYGAWVMVDEAHATGLYGDGGGIVTREGLEDRVHVQMGTLSKALAAQGGYVAGDATLVEYLANAARSFVFSTGLAPPAAAAARKALELSVETDRVERLHENADYLRRELDAVGFDVWGTTHIVPLVVGNPRLVIEFDERLREAGIRVNSVPYPVVPVGTSRLRLTPMATHTREELDAAIDAFERIGTELHVI